MAHIGRLEGVGIAVEATRGTAVSPSIWVKHTELSFQNMTEKVMDESTLGVLMNTSNSDIVKQFSEGEITGQLATNMAGVLFYNLLGALVTTPATTGAYTHDFSMSNTNSKQSLTISKKTPIGEERFANAMLSSMTISATIGEIVQMAVEARAKFGATSSLTTSYVEDNRLFAKNLNIYFADTLAGLDGATAECLTDVELSLTQEIEDDFCFQDGVALNDLHNKGFAIDGNFSKIKNSTTFRDLVDTGGYKAMRIEILDSATTIGVSDNPAVIIDLAKVSFEEYEDDGGLDDIMKENITIKGHYDGVNSADITVQVVNTTASY